MARELEALPRAPKPGLLDRARARLSGWFGPGVPIQIVAPPGTEPRALDYPVSTNMWVTPRTEEPIGFPLLRELADRCTLLRLAIETCKNRLDRFDFAVGPRDAAQRKTLAARDPRAVAIETFLRVPDRVTPWRSWLRKLLEDVYVIDAPAIYLRRARDGSLAALEILDGATIKPVIDITGRPPVDGVAYRQIVKGMPAVDFTREELVYAPRNPRPHRLYGFSVVEQVLLTVNIAIRRELTQLEWFTEGTVPDALFQTPKDWTRQDVREFQLWWDSIHSGNTHERRRLKFVPSGEGAAFTELKGRPLQDEFDEWLARVICYACNLPPNAFIKQMNRATAESAVDAATNEGTIPDMNWVRSLFDQIIQSPWGFDAPDLAFVWQDVREADPLKQAQIAEIHVRTGVRSIDEVREDLGLAPVGFGNAIFTASGPQLLTEILDGTYAPAPIPDALALPDAAPAEAIPPDAPEPARKSVRAALEKRQRVPRSKKRAWPALPAPTGQSHGVSGRSAGGSRGY